MIAQRLRIQPRHHQKPGFAIIVTVSILVLLAVIAVGLLTLSTVSVRTSTQGSAAATARANAKLSLLLALGDLQKHAGPDQRVTGAGILKDENVAQPHWAAVWSTEATDTLPAWLVSGNDTVALDDLDQLSSYPASYQTPTTGASAESFTLFTNSSSADGNEDDVIVPQVKIEGSPSMTGTYSWWISDEGSKARVDIAAPKSSPANNYERLARAGVPQESGFTPIDPNFESMSGPNAVIDKRALLTGSTVGLALEDSDLPKTYFHDLTTGGHGLPVNVIAGGTKADLSLIFDSTQRGNRSLLEEYVGAVPSPTKLSQGTLFEFDDISDPDKFYFVSALRKDEKLPVGPNWGILYNYANQWQTVRAETAPLLGMNPPPQTDLRTNRWAPYQNINEGEYSNDIQHTNSSITPVLAVMQMGFRLTAKETIITPQTGRRPAEMGYQMQLQMKPLIGIWNPYNVKISEAAYRIDWALYPYLRIGIDKPSGEQLRPRIWMREHWKSSSNESPEGSLDRWFTLLTDPVDLEPGEIRLFSVDSNTQMGASNKLVSNWNEEGAFTFDLVYSASGGGGGTAGEPIKVPKGSVAWYGDLFLEDAQHPETIANFGDTYTDGVSASWITFKSGSSILHRVSDIWQTPTNRQRDKLKYAIPEQVISEWVRTGTTADQLPVELIAKSPYHIGTWKWFSRTSTEAVGAQSGSGSQKCRAWVDSNNRFAATNPAWDGSQIGASRGGTKYEGWNFISPFLGASYDGSYDDGPRGRGKIAEGQNEVAGFPEATNTNGRYRGFGGLSTSSSGQTHVALYDVPRSPLISLGQLQHAQLSRYGYEPSLPFGNSYASLRIPLDQTQVDDFGNIPEFRMLDLSHAVNEALWDDYFFSTIGRDYFGPARGGSLNNRYPLKELASGEKTLPNPRHRFAPFVSDESIDEIIQESEDQAPRSLAARIAVEGAFNVHSTSKNAWKAILSSMADFEFPSLSPDGASTSWIDTGGIRFPRFGHVLEPNGWNPDAGPIDPSFWRGFRELDDEELDSLAEEIVKEVRERGPFRSFADFVNRNPDATKKEHQLKGALQAALDRSINADLAGVVGDTATNPQGKLLSEAITNENEAAGFAGYLMQGDLLQSLAPILQVRSDYFRIRASGQATDATGKVLATAICEAYVQRSPDFIDPEDLPHLASEDLTSEVNQHFGRRFRIVSFRWLSPDEA